MRKFLLLLASLLPLVSQAAILRQSAYTGGTFTNWEPWTVTQPSTGDGIAVVAVLQQSAGGTSVSLAVTDNQTGNTYTLFQESPAGASGSSGIQVACFTVGALASVTSPYELTFSATNGTVLAVSAFDFNVGIATDQYAIPSPTTTGATSYTVIAGGANAKADDVVLTALGGQYNASVMGLATPSTGYTQIGLSDSGNERAYIIAEKETASVETSQAAYTWTLSNNYTAAIFTIKAASSSGPPKSQFFFGNVRRSKGAYLEGGLQADLASLLPSLSGAFVPGRALVRELFQDEQYATKRMAIN